MSVPIAIPVDERSALVNQIVKQNLYRVRDKQIKGGLFKTLMDLDIRRNGSIYTRTRHGKIINHLPLIAEGRVRIPPGIWRPPPRQKHHPQRDDRRTRAGRSLSGRRRHQRRYFRPGPPHRSRAFVRAYRTEETDCERELKTFLSPSGNSACAALPSLSRETATSSLSYAAAERLHSRDESRAGV